MVCTTADGQPTQGINGPAVGTLGGAPNIRSGPPDGTCRLKLPAPAPITSVSFTYQYLTGYGTESSTTKGATFELLTQSAAGQDMGPALYTSPVLTKYPYDGCHDKEKCYSPEVDLSASCSSCTGTYLAFKFKNNQRNLLLPLTVTINEFAWGVVFLLALGLAVTAYVVVGGLSSGSAPATLSGGWRPTRTTCGGRKGLRWRRTARNSSRRAALAPVGGARGTSGWPPSRRSRGRRRRRARVRRRKARRRREAGRRGTAKQRPASGGARTDA